MKKLLSFALALCTLFSMTTAFAMEKGDARAIFGADITEAQKAEDRVTAAWAAHSASEDGFLDLPGRRVPLIEDTRLRDLMEKGVAYLRRRHPRILATMPLASIAR